MGENRLGDSEDDRDREEVGDVPGDDSGAEAEDAILESLFDALDRGETIDVEEFARRFPDHAVTVERLSRDVAAYRRMVGRLPNRSPSPYLERGQRLGDFEIGAVVAVGGNSVVYRARQLSVGGRVVALKAMTIGSSGAMERFHRECRILAELRHPCLAEVYLSGEEGGVAFYAMRLIEGPTLRQVVEWLRKRGGPISAAAADRALAWAIDVASALEKMHRSGLVHRDVKPSNILIEAPWDPGGDALPAGRAVLVDFGLARPIQDVAHTGGATLEYAPPEQLLCGPLDPSADVFALGATLHDALSLRLPAERRSAADGLEPLSAVWAGASPELERVIAVATAKDARARYDDASQLAADLRSVRQSQPIDLRRLPWRERVALDLRLRPRRTRLQLAFAGLALLVLPPVVWFVLSERRGISAVARAAERTSIDDLYRAVNDLSPLTRWAMDLWPSTVLRVLDDQDPLASIVREMEAHPDAALRIEAAALRRLGYADPLLTGDFQRRCVDGWDDEVAGLLMRLFLEREVTEAEEWAELSRIEGRLLEEIEREPRSPWMETTLSTLSGLGGPWCLPRLMGLAEGESWGSEVQRLAWMAAERIVRRGHRIGELTDVQLAAVEAALDQPMARVSAEWSELRGQRTWYGSASAAMSLWKATALARRARGQSSRPASFLDLGQGRSTGAPFIHEAAALLAASRDVRTPAVLRALESRPGAVSSQDEWLGSLYALFGDTSTHEESEAFRRGRAYGGRVVAGWSPHTDVDPRSMLEWPGTSPDPIRVEGTRGGDDDAYLARWMFTTSAPVMITAARDVRVHGGGLEPDEGGVPMLLLWGLAGAWVELDFDAIPRDSDAPQWVYIDMLAASRVYLPQQGRADVRFFLKGHENGYLGSVPLDVQRLESRRVVRLPEWVHAPGRHTLRIELGPDTTTTVRISEVQLVRAP